MQHKRQEWVLMNMDTGRPFIRYGFPVLYSTREKAMEAETLFLTRNYIIHEATVTVEIN